jgi:uncharacterized protein
MQAEVIGRYEQKLILDDILANRQASLTVVYGRRRVGKTYLIETYLNKAIGFQYTGIKNVTMSIQIKRFLKQLSLQLKVKLSESPNNWFDVFDLAQKLIAKRLKKDKFVIFLDEFPWISSRKSNFLAAFENFWNTWACKQKQLAIIICGSSASWMIKHVINNKGGLHNRLSYKIRLEPFTLHETEVFLQRLKIYMSRFQIAQIYMALGGIPQYLKQISAGKSAAQNIENLCFSKNGFLYNEFDELFSSLFDKPQNHLKIVKVLSNKPNGLTRNEMIKACKFSSGGTTSILFDELSSAGFITSYAPIGNQKKEVIYKLTDEFSIFYLRFMQSNRLGAKNVWQIMSQTQSYKIWCGLAFESLCLKHIHNIKQQLGITGVYSQEHIWRSSGGKNNFQIDLIIDRKDNCMNLCEIKFYEDTFKADGKYMQYLDKRRTLFKQLTKTRKHLFNTLITTNNMVSNKHSIGVVDQYITLNHLFSEF